MTLYLTPNACHAERRHLSPERFHGPHRPVRRSRSAPHVTQRGNRRETVFFSDADYELYRGLLAEQGRKRGVAVSEPLV